MCCGAGICCRQNIMFLFPQAATKSMKAHKEHKVKPLCTLVFFCVPAV
jgi:hypothetical protein